MEPTDRLDHEQGPNARAVSADGKRSEYGIVGESRLKVRWEAKRSEKGWVEFSPADLHVSLNDIPLLIDELVIIIDPVGRIPRAKVVFSLSELDIDADTMAALEAYVKFKEGE